MSSRYTFGGDEHIFVEVDEAMSLEAFFTSLSMTNAVRDANIKGVTEICPANASFQIKFDPDQIHPDDLMAELKRLEATAESAEPVLKTRIIEIPVYYQDPWTHETLMRFRERHQDPDATDIEYAASVNGYDSVEAFIEAHSGARGSFQWSDSFQAYLSFTNGGPRAPNSGAKIPAPTHRYTETDCRLRRQLFLHLFGARCWWLSDVWDHPDADI